MNTEIVPFDAALLRAMTACMDHARDLLASARLIHQAGRSNIAFHLAVLALEELGRRELLGVKTVEQSGSWADKHFQDHVQKLFWCFFGARLTEERITTEALDAMKGFATRLHSQRLAGLYVDVRIKTLPVTLSIPGEGPNTSPEFKGIKTTPFYGSIGYPEYLRLTDAAARP